MKQVADGVLCIVHHTHSPIFHSLKQCREVRTVMANGCVFSGAGQKISTDITFYEIICMTFFLLITIFLNNTIETKKVRSNNRYLLDHHIQIVAP